MTSSPDPVAILEAAGWQPARPPERVTGGWDTLIWRFRTADGRDHALRLHRPREDPERLRLTAANEVASLRALAAAGLPAPAVEGEGLCHGVPYSIQEWVPGELLMELLRKQPWRVWQLGRMFGRMHARLHRICPPDVRTIDADDWLDLLPPALAEAAARESRPVAFCHLDYHPGNVLVKGSAISGIIDFTDARIADPAFDIGRTRALLLVSPLPAGPLRPVYNQFRKLLARAWQSGYRAEAGRLPESRVFDAAGIAIVLDSVRTAVAEGRGWATERDVRDVERTFARALRAAGLS